MRTWTLAAVIFSSVCTLGPVPVDLGEAGIRFFLRFFFGDNNGFVIALGFSFVLTIRCNAAL